MEVREENAPAPGLTEISISEQGTERKNIGFGPKNDPRDFRLYGFRALTSRSVLAVEPEELSRG